MPRLWGLIASSSHPPDYILTRGGPIRYHHPVFMYDPSLQAVVLAKLVQWERLTESDLNAMLRPEDRLRLRDDMLQDMAHSGLITMRVVGDEPGLHDH